MWKRFGVISVLFFILFIFFLGAGPLLAACGVDPPIPPGGFAWPLDGEISQGWSLDCGSDRGHRGIDIAAGSGLPVRAAAAGTVSFVGYTPAEGGSTTVTIDHEGGLRSTYLHVAATVSKGQTVNQGEAIGHTDGSPLHFGVKLPGGSRDTYFNPVDLLPARAAPLQAASLEPSEQLATSLQPVMPGRGGETDMPPAQAPQVSEEPAAQVPAVSAAPLTRGAQRPEASLTETPVLVASPSDRLAFGGFEEETQLIPWWPAPDAHLQSQAGATIPEHISGSQLTPAAIASRSPAIEVRSFSEPESGAAQAAATAHYPKTASDQVASRKGGKKAKAPVSLRDPGSYIPMTLAIMLMTLVAAGLPVFLARQAKKGMSTNTGCRRILCA